MTSRTKLLALAIILMFGIGGAVIFRKDPPSADESAPAEDAAAVTASEDLRPKFEKPAPLSHLTGRIESSDQATTHPTVVPTEGSSSFGMAATPPGAGAYSAMPPASGAAPSGISYRELRRHRIADGDTLSSLAQRYLGSASRYKEVHELNRDLLGDNADLLPIGKELKIPDSGPSTFVPAGAPLDARPMVPVAPRGSAAPSSGD